MRAWLQEATEAMLVWLEVEMAAASTPPVSILVLISFPVLSIALAFQTVFRLDALSPMHRRFASRRKAFDLGFGRLPTPVCIHFTSARSMIPSSIMDIDDLYIKSLSIDRDEIPDWSEHPFSVPAISSTKELLLDSPITLFCGENGTGKSTLLEAISIAYGLNAEGGSRNYMFSVKDTSSVLSDFITLRHTLHKPKDSFFVRSDTLFNLMTEMDNLDDDCRYYEGTSLHERSRGESILTLISKRFGGNGLYILDEPETGLSQCGHIVLLGELLRLSGEGSQFIIATHSPILMAAENARIYEFSDAINVVEKEDTVEWIMLKRFFDNPEETIETFMKD